MAWCSVFSRELERLRDGVATTRKHAGDKALTRGHRIRRAVWDAAAADDRIVRFASEHSKLPRDKGVRVLAAAPEAKAGSVAPFAVHIAIENVRRAGYFTEKLLDCFLLRTVPVYWGCPDLAAHGFDIDGVVFIDDGGDDEAAVARAAVALFKVRWSSVMYDRAPQFAGQSSRALS